MIGGEFSGIGAVSPIDSPEHIAHVEGAPERSESRLASLDPAVLDEIYGDLIDQVVAGEITESDAQAVIDSLAVLDN